ncbi:MAG: tetratricopeptide repeat protein, partial [Chloroflexota bacterium]
PAAHNSLGLALLNVKRFDDALKVYNRAHVLAPDDPIPLEKSADVLERLGRLQEAAQQYVTVADVYMGQRDLDKAIGNWERATRLTPGLLQIHLRLAQAYERTGQKRSAVREYLTLAFNFQRTGDKNKALQAAERARRLEPTSPQVLNSLQAIESDSLMMPPDMDDADKAPPASHASVFSDEMDSSREQVSNSDPKGPLGEATEKALEKLAEIVLNSDLSAGSSAVIQAIELQKIEDYQAAAETYKKAEGYGLRYSSMLMGSGAVLVELKNWEEAEKYLLRVKDEHDFAAGAAHGLGVVYMGLQQPYKAAEQLIAALRLVDTELAINPDEASQLAAVYSALLKNSQKLQQGDLNIVNEQFVKWLTGADWKIRIAETRRSLSERLSQPDGEKGIIDYVKDSKTVEMVRQIDGYIKQGLLTLAMDEAFLVIEKEPTFLPVHQRVAQILMEEGKIQSAINKYNIIANSFLARDDTARAAEILNEVIAVAPMDIGLRTSLIELLEREQQWGKLLEEYISLANAYYQLADMEQARVTYQEALKLAQKQNATPQKRAEILRKIADIDMSRLDVRQALRNYEQVRTLDPNDEAARRAIVDLHYRLNNSVEAVKELDGLLRMFAQQKRGDLIIGTLEQMVTNAPNDMALRSRLAAVYRQTNRRLDAIAQLDALGELQLEAGLYQDACATIKQIVTLQPNDMEQYRNLLAQLGC